MNFRRARRWRPPVLLAGAACVLAAAAGGGAAASASPGFPVVTQLGATDTNNSVNSWDPASAVKNATSVLDATVSYQDQSIMDWGVLDIEPNPGVFAWSTLDSRIAFIQSTNSSPVITLCASPDWMKGGVPGAGAVDWSNVGAAPTPLFYEQFARLAVDVARRYPKVHDFLVWNELKGLWDAPANDWDIEDYTALYNTVYRALKDYNPELQVGGPYIDFSPWGSPSAGGHPSDLSGAYGTIDQRSIDAFEYWKSHKAGADFVVVDGGIDTKDGVLDGTPMAATSFFSSVTGWLKSQTSLPVWWSEWYTGIPSELGPATGTQEWIATSTEACSGCTSRAPPRPSSGTRRTPRTRRRRGCTPRRRRAAAARRAASQRCSRRSSSTSPRTRPRRTSRRQRASTSSSTASTSSWWTPMVRATPSPPSTAAACRSARGEW
jgi:hypothetical protein